MKNPYFVLGLHSDSPQTAIKQAYQRLARKYHPDKNIGDEKRVAILFQEVKSAYELLSNPVKRYEYDESQRNALVDNPEEVAQELWTGYINRLVETAGFFEATPSKDGLAEYDKYSVLRW